MTTTPTAGQMAEQYADDYVVSEHGKDCTVEQRIKLAFMLGMAKAYMVSRCEMEETFLNRRKKAPE